MFKYLGKKLAEMVEAEQQRRQRLIAGFDDPVAAQTEWTPAAGGGANFRTHKLVEVAPDRMEFRPTLGMRLFCAIFFLVGVGMLAGYFFIEPSRVKGSPWVMLLIGLLFAGIGGAMYYFSSRPRVFDMQSLLYWKGKPPLDRSKAEQRDDAAPLDMVHAIQILREYCRSSGKNSRSYYSYELNLVMHDGSRVNVVDHGNLRAIRRDAERLGRFIGVPVWDAT